MIHRGQAVSFYANGMQRTGIIKSVGAHICVIRTQSGQLFLRHIWRVRRLAA